MSAGVVKSFDFSFLDQEGLTAPNSYVHCDLSGCTESEDRHLKASELRKECFQNIIELIEPVQTKICWESDWQGDLMYILGEALKNAFKYASLNTHGKLFASVSVNIHNDQVMITTSNSTHLEKVDLEPHPCPSCLEEAISTGRGIGIIMDLIEKTFHGIAEWIVIARERVDLVLRLNFAPAI